MRPVLPEPLSALGEIAGNLRWSWHPPSQDLFESIDPELWRTSHLDPVRMLGTVATARLEELAGDQAFLARLDELHRDLTGYLEDPQRYLRHVIED